MIGDSGIEDLEAFLAESRNDNPSWAASLSTPVEQEDFENIRNIALATDKSVHSIAGYLLHREVGYRREYRNSKWEHDENGKSEDSFPSFEEWYQKQMQEKSQE